LYTWRIEPHRLEIVRRPLPIRGLPAALAGSTLAQISDVHVGLRVDDDYLLNVFPGWSHADIADRVVSIAARSGIPILRNDVVNVYGLQIVGMDDLWAKRFQPEAALSKLDASQAAIVLSHNRDTVDLPVWRSYDQSG
jgi:hypothetical protein